MLRQKLNPDVDIDINQAEGAEMVTIRYSSMSCGRVVLNRYLQTNHAVRNCHAQNLFATSNTVLSRAQNAS